MNCRIFRHDFQYFKLCLLLKESMRIGVLEIDGETKYDFDHLLKNLLITSEEAIHIGDEGNYLPL